MKMRGVRKWSSSRQNCNRLGVTDVEVPNQPPANTSNKSRPDSQENCNVYSSKPSSDLTSTASSLQSRIPWLEKLWKPFVEDVPKPQKKRSTRRPRITRYLSPDVKALELASTLVKYPPPDPVEADEIWLEAAFLKSLTGTVEENIWKHHDGSGCLVHVKPSTKKDKQTRKVTLIGSQRARDIASQHLQSLQKSYQEQNVEDPLSESQRHIDPHAHNARIRVDQLPRPSEWNLKSFSAYVKAVTSARASRNIERILYPGSATFNKTAAEILVDLFEDPDLRPFQSSFALRQALQLCSVNTDIAFAARRIWVAARQAGIVPDIACFNYELSRSFKIRNVPGVSHLVQELRNTHIQPDGATWACFFSSLRSKEEHDLFLRFPAVQKAKFDQVSKDVMIQAFVKTSFEPSDRNHHCLHAFKKRVIGAFGREWLSLPVLRSMIDKCTNAGAFRVLSNVLELATEQSLIPDADTHTSLLHAVIDTECFDDVLALVNLQTSPSEPGLDKRQIELMFQEAWRQRLFNTCRVLWYYAASHALTQHSMVIRIAQALARNVFPGQGSGVTTATRMAAIVIGTDRLRAVNSTCNSEPQDKAILEALASLSQWTLDGRARHDQMQLVHALIERDMTAWQRYAPMDNSTLMNLMDEAFALDILWLEQDKILLAPMAELLQQAISIDLRQLKDSTPVPETKPDTEDKLSESQNPTLSNSMGLVMPKGSDETVVNKIFLTQNEAKAASAEEKIHALSFQDFHQTDFPNDTPVTACSVVTASFSTSLVDILLLRLGLA